MSSADAAVLDAAESDDRVQRVVTAAEFYRGLSIELLPLEINKLVRQAESAAESAFGNAVVAGVLLRRAKEEVPHGQWEAWLAEHCTVSVRSAQGYMRLSKKALELPAEKRNAVAGLPLREALKAIAGPPAQPAQPAPPRYRPPLSKATAAREALQAVDRRVSSLARDLGVKSIKPERIKSMREALLVAVAEMDKLLSEVPIGEN